VVEEEAPGEFDGFINDEEDDGSPEPPFLTRQNGEGQPSTWADDEDDSSGVPGTPAEDVTDEDAQVESPLGSQGNQYRYTPDRCEAIGFDEDGNEVVCGNDKNPAEQLCHDCRVYGLRLTGLL